MSLLLVKVVSALFMLGNYFFDGPMPPPLDFVLRIFGFRMVPLGIQQVWPLLLTYVAPPEEVEDVPVLSWISEWLAIGNNPVLRGLILGLTYWAIMHFYGWIDSFGGRAIPPVLKGDAEYKAKVLKHIQRAYSSRGDSPKDGHDLANSWRFDSKNTRISMPFKSDQQLWTQLKLKGSPSSGGSSLWMLKNLRMIITTSFFSAGLVKQL